MVFSSALSVERVKHAQNRRRDRLRRVLLLSALLCVAVVLAVAPVSADTKVMQTKTIRMYGYQPEAMFVPGVGLCDVEAYLTSHGAAWATKDGSSRTVSNVIGTAKLWFSGEVVGEGVMHSTVVIIVPEWPCTSVNQVDRVFTVHGSGQFLNYHMITVYVNGELVAFHIVGGP